MTATIRYQGDLRCVMTHAASGNEVITDAPTDNHGKGQAFSPTDLVAAALGSCMLTVMGIKANQMQFSMDGTTVEITKVMYSEPRRIGEIRAIVTMPPNSFSEKDRTILERTARTCPVLESLHPDLKKEIAFVWC